MPKLSKKVKKVRLDDLLVEKAHVADRERALAMVMAGRVLVGGQKVRSPALLVDPKCEIRLLGLRRFVSRGGDKLQSAIEGLALQPLFQEAVVMDVGASTGGFTDCCLQNGAKKVYAVDVGSNQLAWKLRQDDRVEVMEKTDIRSLVGNFREKLDWVVADISFNSLDNLLPSILAVISDRRLHLLLLIKPQFELEAELVPKGGVVTDEGLQRLACQRVQSKLEELGLKVLATLASKVLGRSGNQEYFVLALQE